MFRQIVEAISVKFWWDLDQNSSKYLQAHNKQKVYIFLPCIILYLYVLYVGRYNFLIGRKFR